jgi:hypothetical protein
MKQPIEKFSMIFIPGIVTGLLIALFLAGKIIDYPRGTPQGGIIGGIGVLVIIVSVIAINYLILRLKKYLKR